VDKSTAIENAKLAELELQKYTGSAVMDVMRTAIGAQYEKLKEQLVDEPTETLAGRAEQCRALLRMLETKEQVDKQTEITY